MRDLRRYNLERTFAHQFRLAATPQPARSKSQGGRRRRSTGRTFFRPFRYPQPKKLALAAAKHAEREELLKEIADERMRRHIARARARNAHRSEDQNALSKSPLRKRHMSRWELYNWYRQMGKLELFFELYRPR